MFNQENIDMANNYNDALERAKQAIIDCGSNASRKEMIYGIFPELRENEEDKIKDTLHSIICRAINDQGTPYEERVFISKKVVPYVEKLQEQHLEAINSASDGSETLASLEKEQGPMHFLEIPAGDIAPAEEDGPFDEDEFLDGELSAFLQNYDKEYDDDAAVSDVARHFYEIGKKTTPNLR